jgi:hypothetical protein
MIPVDRPNYFRWERPRLLYVPPNSGWDSSTWDKSVRPKPAQWREFWKICDEIGVWSWPPSLGDRRVCDGLQWTTELEVGCKRVKASGQIEGSPKGFKDKADAPARGLAENDRLEAEKK